jgi:hypothetical protein
MKRALAERARQAEALEKQLQQQHEAAVTNVKDQQNHFDRGSHSIQVPVNTVTSDGGSLPTTNLSGGKLNVQSSEILIRSPRGETCKNVRPQSPSSVDSQRPSKIPRLQVPPTSVPSLSSTLVRENSTSAPSVTNSSLVPTSTNRRSSLDAQQAMSENHDSSSSFYLKYQNRALATELKSYQYAVAELEQERDLRRSHCLSISTALYQIHSLWNSMEQDIVSQRGAPSGDNQTTPIPNTEALDEEISSAPKSDPEIPRDQMSSTGTDDSVEWTRLLYNALCALGQSSVAPAEGSSTVDDSTSDYVTDLRSLDQTVCNIFARARVLQEWVHSIIKNRMKEPSRLAGSVDSENCVSAEESTRMQQQVSEITARCATLESQIAELVSCRTSLIHRERKLRRNIYRMAADIITPEQVVSAITRDESDDNDDIEASVQIEKQRFMMMKRENPQVDSNTTSSSGPTHCGDINGASNSDMDVHVSTFQLEEYQSRIASLEDLLGNAERSIQEVRRDYLLHNNVRTFLLIILLRLSPCFYLHSSIVH